MTKLIVWGYQVMMDGKKYGLCIRGRDEGPVSSGIDLAALQNWGIYRTTKLVLINTIS